MLVTATISLMTWEGLRHLCVTGNVILLGQRPWCTRVSYQGDKAICLCLFLGCPQNKQFFVSVRTETNRNSIRFGSFLVFSRNWKKFTVYFGVLERFEANRNKNRRFETNLNWRLLHFYVMDLGMENMDMDMNMVKTNGNGQDFLVSVRAETIETRSVLVFFAKLNKIWFVSVFLNRFKTNRNKKSTLGNKPILKINTLLLNGHERGHGQAH